MIELPKQLQDDIDAVSNVAKDMKMQLYIVGGFPRDIVNGKGITDDTDLDVTEENGNGFDLSFFVAAKYNLPSPIIYDGSGTALVVMPSGRPVEFHNSSWNAPHIIDQLYIMGIPPTALNKDVYSRDFTINTLLFDPVSGEIIDPTGKGIQDIEGGILRTPISAAKLLSLDPKRILRGIRFKIEFGLKEDEEYSKAVTDYIPPLIEFLKKNPTSKMVQRTVKKTLEIDSKKAVAEYKRFGLLPYLPKEIEIDNVMKEDLFGTKVTPVSIKTTAQSKMMEHLINEREKHKAYMRRKKREDKESKMEKMKILERARKGFYINNPEPDFVKNRKVDKNRELFKYISQGDYSDAG